MFKGRGGHLPKEPVENWVGMSSRCVENAPRSSLGGLLAWAGGCGKKTRRGMNPAGTALGLPEPRKAAFENAFRYLSRLLCIHPVIFLKCMQNDRNTKNAYRGWCSWPLLSALGRPLAALGPLLAGLGQLLVALWLLLAVLKALLTVLGSL